MKLRSLKNGEYNPGSVLTVDLGVTPLVTRGRFKVHPHCHLYDFVKHRIACPDYYASFVQTIMYPLSRLLCILRMRLVVDQAIH